MFRPVRKKKNEINIQAAKDLLKNTPRGILAVNGDDGYPYAIPVNYLYDEDRQQIIFHGAKVGHKVDALKRSDKVCFTVYGNIRTKEEEWAPYVQSAVAFGRCHMVEDRDETIRLVKKLAMKYFPGEQMVDEEIEKSGAGVRMFVIEIEHLSGKEVQER